MQSQPALSFWRAWVTCLVSHPAEAFRGGGRGDACPSSEFQKQYWRRGHTHVAVGILLYCIAIFHVAVTVSTYFHVICQQLPSVLCCRFKATLLVGILPYMTGAWLWVWHLVWLWAHTTFQHFKILREVPTSILISVEQCDICPVLDNF